MEISALYRIAREQNIEVLTFPMEKTGSMSIMVEGGTCYIGMDQAVQDGGTQERVHLAHELGHCVTGSFYNRYAAVDSRRRHENRADRWAISQIIPPEALDQAIASGYTELWELTEFFGVTEDFVRKAVCLYVHGNLATELYF
jgi:hypothetical protein